MEVPWRSSSRPSLHSEASMADSLRSFNAFLVFAVLPAIAGLSSDSPLPVCDVTAFGASGSGLSYDTTSIQLAIDSCSALGGGSVLVPSPGLYLTGTVFLRSRIVLHIEAGATLLGSPSQDHYPPEQWRWYVVLAENASDVGITGGGVINGQGFRFVKEFNEKKNVMVSWNETGACLGDECRPRLIGFLDCERVSVWDIHLHQPAHWCLHVVRSSHVLIHDVSILGDFNTPNNDGIDIEGSNNTAILRCHIDTGDDAICLKTMDGPLRNLTVSRCWVRTKSCGVKLGSGSNFDFENVSVDDMDIVDSHRGLGLQLRDSGNISGVVFSNIRISTRYYDPSWWGRAEPIYVTSCPRASDTVVGSIANVQFVNISAVAENGIVLSGSCGGMLHNLKLQNVQVQLQRFTKYQSGLLDYRPGCQGLIKHQNSGVFIQDVSNLILQNVTLYLAPSIQLSVVPLEFTPHTITGSVHLVNFSIVALSSLSDAVST